MARVLYSCTSVNNGMQCVATVRLSCGHDVMARATARDGKEETAQKDAKALLDSSVRGHQAQCARGAHG